MGLLAIYDHATLSTCSIASNALAAIRDWTPILWNTMKSRTGNPLVPPELLRAYSNCYLSRQCHRNNFGTRDLRSANLGSPNRSTSNNELLAEDTSYRPMDHEEIETKSLQMATKTGSNMDNATSFGGISLVQTPLTSETLSAPLISRTDISISRQITGSGAARHPPVTPNYTGGMFSRSGLASRTPVSFGTSPNCPRCGKAVYFAEQVNAVGKKWHKACLTCAGCRKRLDSFSLQEHEDEPYCKACHIRQFGIRDLRSANLSPTTSA
ncbi:hypothetical protein FRC16_002991 [Serendipita sp. 398]|nr:hypothetical protein FRC16_002991 [Serendipita sp. 398]